MAYTWTNGEVITAEKLNNTNDTFDIWLWQTGAPGYAWQYIGDHSLTKAH